MASIIIGIKTPSGETIKVSDEELEVYAEEFLRLCQVSKEPMLFEQFLRWKAMCDAHYMIERCIEQRMWFEERERQVRIMNLFSLSGFYDSITDARELRAGGLL